MLQGFWLQMVLHWRWIVQLSRLFESPRILLLGQRKIVTPRFSDLGGVWKLFWKGLLVWFLRLQENSRYNRNDQSLLRN